MKGKVTLIFTVIEELRDRGWIIPGANPSEIEEIVLSVIQADEAKLRKSNKYEVRPTDDYFEVMDVEKKSSRLAPRLIAKFYPWPDRSGAKKLAGKLADELNILDAKLEEWSPRQERKAKAGTI